MSKRVIGAVALLLFLTGCATVKRDGHETMTGMYASGYEYTTSAGLDVVVSRSLRPGYSVYIINQWGMSQAYRDPDHYLLDLKARKAAIRAENDWIERQSIVAAREAVIKHTGCEVETAEYNSGTSTVRVTVKCRQ